MFESIFAFWLFIRRSNDFAKLALLFFAILAIFATAKN